MNVLAANDQENLAASMHAAAAGKSLNASLKGFNAKTPGNKAPKTPFKISLNDENASKAGKTNGKGNGNLLMTMRKGGKLEDNAFVTPAGARTRAPLGMKTTNAKARAFQTPAPLSGSAKTQKISPRLRRPKVKIHQPEAHEEEEDEVPEIEYMPPKMVPLADEMEHLPTDWKFPMFEGQNMTRGVYSAYINPIEDDGRTKKEREFEQGLARDRKKRDEEFDRIFKETMARDEAEARRRLGIESPKKAAPKGRLPPKKKMLGPSTVRSKSAAAALSPVPKPDPIAPTTMKSRVPSSLLPSRRPAKPVMNPSTSRYAAATAASKSTIGYAQGRPTSTAARKPLSNVMKPAPFSVTARQPTAAPSAIHSRTTSVASAGSKRTFSRASSNTTLVTPPQENDTFQTTEDMECEMQLLLLQDDADDEDVDAWMNHFNSQLGADALNDEFADFQLQLPEDL